MAESKLVHAPILTYASMISLLSLCPPFVILLWHTMVHADGSVVQTFEYLKEHGFEGLEEIWPKPSATAFKIIACYAVFEALLCFYLENELRGLSLRQGTDPYSRTSTIEKNNTPSVPVY